MSKKFKTAAWTAAFILFIAAAALAYNVLSKKTQLPNGAGDVSPGESLLPDGEEKDSQEEERAAAPDFTVYDADGKAFKLSEFLGGPVVLNFWASWCPPCRAEMPLFDEAYLERGAAVTFMMINLADGSRETREKAMQYVKEQGFSFPLYFDLDQEAAARYSLTSIPMTVFVDRDGYIVSSVIGVVDQETLQSGIDLIE